MCKERLDLKPASPALSPIQLAYLGDAVYDLIVRRYVLEKYPGHLNNMNKKKKYLVCAKSQSVAAGYLLKMEILTEEEKNIYRRARNHKTNSRSKNATLTEYHRATGLEAVFAFLYLERRYDRLRTLANCVIRHLESLQDK